MDCTWMGDQSSVEADAVVRNTEKISGVEKRGLQNIPTPGTTPPPQKKKTKFLINYSSYRDTGRIFFLKYNQIKNVFLLTVQYDHKNMFFSS